MPDKKLIITTSWDDGHPLDLKIAELLAKYGINGTFYVPIKNSENIVMKDNQLKNIAGKFEIGGHTVNHLYLNSIKLNEAKNEISQCKAKLQDKLGTEIKAFCFPGGKYSKRDIDLVKNAGFLFARTCNFFHTSNSIRLPLMNTSTQVYNHKFSALIIHCAKRNFFSPIIKYNLFISYDKNFRKLTKAVLNDSIKKCGIFHLWGHSWEIEKFGLWNELEETLKMLANENEALFLNNSQYWYHINKKNVLDS